VLDANKCARFPYYQRDPEAYKAFMRDYYYFLVEGHAKPFGYVHKSTIEQVDWNEHWCLDNHNRLLILKAVDDLEERSRRVNVTLQDAHQAGKLQRWKGWTQESFAVDSPGGERVLNMHLLGADILGAVVSGVTLIAWTRTDEGRQYWLQKRSQVKVHHPGKLDTTASGGIQLNERPIDAMVREAAEEAGIPEDFAKANLICCDTISYHIAVNHDGSPGSCPHVQYTYEIELHPGMAPRPCDNEVDNFVKMSECEVREALFGDEFKITVGAIWLGHFCRHGILKPEDEVNYKNICSRLHRQHDLFIPL
jgi:8-oxo-dGTP pyrophosphatase MutT (NUDIX family)